MPEKALPNEQQLDLQKIFRNENAFSLFFPLS